MNYRQLQAALKTARNNGSVLTVKLNAKKEVLQAEYDRIMAEAETESESNDHIILFIDDADLDYKELAEKRRMEAKQRANRYHTDKELIEFVARAAKSRGYSENESQTYGQKFMECWNTQGYTTAFHRYLKRLQSPNPGTSLNCLSLHQTFTENLLTTPESPVIIKVSTHKNATMNYRQLQAELKIARKDGLTTISLNAKKEVLQAEYDRLQLEGSYITPFDYEYDIDLYRPINPRAGSRQLRQSGSTVKAQ